MQAILLDENQASVVSQSSESVPVHDEAGTVLGHIVPNGTGNGAGPGANHGRFDKDHWIQCWDEWYLEPDEREAQQPETD